MLAPINFPNRGENPPPPKGYLAYYFGMINHKTRFIATKVSTLVYDIFFQIDQALIKRFYPKYKEVASAIADERLHLHTIGKAEAEGLLFFRFFFRPYKWEIAVTCVENLYKMQVISNSFLEVLQNVYIQKDSHKIGFFSQSFQDNNWKKMGFSDYPDSRTENLAFGFPLILSESSTLKFDRSIEEGLTPFLLENFLHAMRFDPNEKNKQIINNMFLFLSILRLETKTQLDEWEIDTNTFAITKLSVGVFAYYSNPQQKEIKNTVTLNDFVSKNITREKIGSAISPILTSYRKKFYSFIREDEYYKTVMEDIVEDRDL